MVEYRTERIIKNKLVFESKGLIRKLDFNDSAIIDVPITPVDMPIPLPTDLPIPDITEIPEKTPEINDIGFPWNGYDINRRPPTC